MAGASVLRSEAFPLSFEPMRWAPRVGGHAMNATVARKLRVVPQAIRAAGHCVLAANDESQSELRVIRVEKGAALEVGASLAVAILCPDSHASVRAAAGSFFLPRRSWMLLEGGSAPVVRNLSARTAWVVAFDGGVLHEQSRLFALWPDTGRLPAGVLTRMREHLGDETSLDTLAYLFESLVDPGTPAFEGRNAERTRQVHRRVRNARLYLQGNLHAGATVEDAAQVALLSKWYFSKMFQKLYGTSPQAWAAELRITRARHLIFHSRLPLQEIGALCGFENPGSMSRAFKSRYGASARELRGALSRVK